jgi:DNA-binding response OmpR family regulator/HPt (histidine-containing phosphotransfer) domain-containing protein
MSDLETTLEKLRAEYASKLPGRLKLLDDAWSALQRQGRLPELFSAFQREIHKLAGDAGSFGYAEVSQVAGQIEQSLLATASPALPALEPLLARLKQAAGKPPQVSARPVPASLRLAASDKKLGDYLLLQWNPLEANWKALQWAWDAETFKEFRGQVHVLHDNAEAFGYDELRDALRHADKWLQELGDNAPSAFQLSNLHQQMQWVTRIMELLREAGQGGKPFALVGRGGKPPEHLRLAASERHVWHYLAVQARQAESLWQTLQWNWHPETLRALREQLLVLGKNSLACALVGPARAVQEAGEFLLRLSRRANPPDSEELAHLGRLMGKLGQAADTLAQQGDTAIAQAGTGRLLYLVDDDEELAGYLSAQLQLAGYRVQVFNRLAGLGSALQREAPAALLVDIMLAEGELAGPRAMFQLQKGRDKPLPVVYISSRQDMQARLAATRAHGGAYFTKPIDLDALLDKLEDLLQPSEETAPARILLVDNTQDKRVREYARQLQAAGFVAKLLDEPMRLLDALDKVQPRLLLMHSHLRGCNAMELAAVAHQDARYQHLPIIFYAMRFGDTWKLSTRLKVGDAMLGEDISPAQLVATVTAHLHV